MKIKLDPAPWEGREAVTATWQEAGYRRFALVGRTDIISAETAGGDLLLYPERSAQHRALIAAFGLNQS